MAEAETAVREYLMFLNNPAELRDEDRIQELQNRLDETSDPIERLDIRTQLSQAQGVDESHYRDAFVEVAKNYATDRGITADVFAAEGVPQEVLEEAGLAKPAKKTTRTRVSSDDVRDHVKSRADEFTYQDVEDATGCSLATARKVVRELVDAGELQEREDPDHDGRGRPQKLFKNS